MAQFKPSPKLVAERLLRYLILNPLNVELWGAGADGTAATGRQGRGGAREGCGATRTGGARPLGCGCGRIDQRPHIQRQLRPWPSPNPVQEGKAQVRRQTASALVGHVRFRILVIALLPHTHTAKVAGS